MLPLFMRSRSMRSTGFAPLIGDDARVLILGSLPGKRSLREQQYYAHPQNSFWRIMAQLVQIDPANSYAERCSALKENRIALWDVLASAHRAGSLDSAIEVAGARKNDFAGLLNENQGIRLICFNGRKSRELFDRLVVEDLPSADNFQLVNLPSSSPAHAAMKFDMKLKHWSVVGRFLVEAKF
jgi:TDG/mug DNA glycosylase family protein